MRGLGLGLTTESWSYANCRIVHCQHKNVDYASTNCTLIQSCTVRQFKLQTAKSKLYTMLSPIPPNVRASRYVHHHPPTCSPVHQPPCQRMFTDFTTVTCLHRVFSMNTIVQSFDTLTCATFSQLLFLSLVSHRSKHEVQLLTLNRMMTARLNNLL